ncbi:hypothetical protein HHI36_000886 [Cryptolaemus montrouzieri]|uniref:Uncharacterized protein n=1 Tax=Cryptolaemus montrouzieri TaxID=559131 RepID=A0ABD2P6I3_9CUCU
MVFLQLFRTSLKSTRWAHQNKIFKQILYSSTEDGSPCSCPCCPQPCDPCENGDHCDPFKKKPKLDPCTPKRTPRRVCRADPESPDPTKPCPNQPTPCKPRCEDCSDC